MKAVTFIDEATVKLAAGDGGNGCRSFRREKFVPNGGPDGGAGGAGGSGSLQASKDTSSLLPLFYQPHQRAGHGEHGRGKQQAGKNGADLYVKVPCGTEVRTTAGDWVGEVVNDGDVLCVARGGKGGLGNMHFATPSHQAPTETTPGAPGEVRELKLEMKTVAEIGLVGYPNAGKSSLLTAISPAHPKIAPYPFTTLHPVIGTIVYAEDHRTLRMADIPGLIDGAHAGVGLGHAFLRHIERTRFLVYVIDMSGIEGRDPADDFENLKQELRLHSPDLVERPYLVAANKMDLPEAAEHLPQFCARTGEQPLPISAMRGDGIAELKRILRQKLLDCTE